MRYNNSRNFWKIKVVNCDLNHWEETYIEIDNYKVWYWKYTWINRSYQRFDFQQSCKNAIRDMLDSISWDTYESIRWDLLELREFLDTWFRF